MKMLFYKYQDKGYVINIENLLVEFTHEDEKVIVFINSPGDYAKIIHMDLDLFKKFIEFLSTSQKTFYIGDSFDEQP